jgi:hypothetical protein
MAASSSETKTARKPARQHVEQQVPQFQVPPEMAQAFIAMMAQAMSAAAQPAAAPAPAAKKAKQSKVAPNPARSDKAIKFAQVADANEGGEDDVGGALVSAEPVALPGRRWVLSYAQNATSVHTKLMASLRGYCKEQKATLLIAPRVHHPRKADGKSKKADAMWWDEAIEPFVCDKPVKLGEHIVFCADLNISPTIVNPLSTLDTCGRGRNVVLPHPKVQMKSCPRLKNAPERLLWTTGSVTVKNFGDTKAELRAAQQHSYGALVVELDDEGNFWARQLVANESGEFADLDRIYTPTGSHRCRVRNITFPDVHASGLTDDVADVYWGRNKNSIVETLRPEALLVHDILNMQRRGHHNIDDVDFRYLMWRDGTESVRSEVSHVALVLSQMERPWLQVYVVYSNHHEHLNRWISEANPRLDPVNLKDWHWYNYKKFDAMDRHEEFDVFEFAVREHQPLKRTIFLGVDQSFVTSPETGGVEHGCHGHLGPNGARGSASNHKNLGAAITRAHDHTASVDDAFGCWTVGSMNEELGYNSGPTSWVSIAVSETALGTRQQLMVRKTRNGYRWHANDNGPKAMAMAA